MDNDVPDNVFEILLAGLEYIDADIVWNILEKFCKDDNKSQKYLRIIKCQIVDIKDFEEIVDILKEKM
jgi:hypothetical protein